MDIIVQAGGRGSRLGHHTDNKPKAMVSVNNLPIIFHLFRKFPNERFLIITDYKSEVLKRYLEVFAEVDYELIKSAGCTGTCSGIDEALKYVSDNEMFMIVWSDLILSDNLIIPSDNENYMGVSKKFECRWRFIDGRLEDQRSHECGVAGVFVFKNKFEIHDVPPGGEFVKWLKNKDIVFKPFDVYETFECGDINTLPMPDEGKCRPFNNMEMRGNRIVKEGIDEQGRMLAKHEKMWYAHVMKLGYTHIPQIHSLDPLEMEMIEGKNVYSYKLDVSEKKTILIKMIEYLRELHDMEKTDVDRFSIVKAYYDKTMERLEKVRGIIPYADKETININGRVCRNVFFHKNEIKKVIEEMECPEFRLIHGDCTFSNIILDRGQNPVFIDPRGYFGNTERYGDPKYDWTKMYYSLYGNYDQFNLRRFRLKISDDVELKIDSNGWEDAEDLFFNMLSEEIDKRSTKFIHAMIWLSLTTYAWDDYDSICGAFYNGLYYLEEVL